MSIQRRTKVNYDRQKADRIASLLDSLKSEQLTPLKVESITLNKDENSSKGFWSRFSLKK